MWKASWGSLVVRELPSDSHSPSLQNLYNPQDQADLVFNYPAVLTSQALL